jgi:hypothetical protein
MTRKRTRRIYQLKVTLKGSKPPIWRRLLVPSDIRLDELHLVLQTAMGWMNCHLHQFMADNVYYSLAAEGFELDFDMEDERRYRLSDLLWTEKDSLIYEYDFGDSWEHKLVLEKILPDDQQQKLPLCIKGSRACPPEDCGGIPGYAELLEVLKNPADPEYEDMVEWLGGEFDAEAFDVKSVNWRLG